MVAVRRTHSVMVWIHVIVGVTAIGAVVPNQMVAAFWPFARFRCEITMEPWQRSVVHPPQGFPE